MQFNGNLSVTPDRDRAILEGLRRKAPGKIISPSFIRLEQTMASAQTIYDFIIQKNVGNPSATERRLDLNDAFVATKIGMYLLKDDLALPGHAALQTYPNPVEFDVEALNMNPTHLECFYNGHLKVQVGTKVFAEAMAARKFRVVRTTQQDVAAATPPPSAKLSESHGFDGLVDSTPQFIFEGQEKTILELFVPGGNGQQVQYVTDPHRNKVVWYMEGFLIAQGSGLGDALSA